MKKETEIKRAIVKQLKVKASSPKSALIQLIRELEEVSPRAAASLGSIVARLEDWQHTA